jgi:hypothetical protein
MASERSTFIGALSFEERCVAGLELTRSEGVTGMTSTLFDYRQMATPGEDASELRQRSWTRASMSVSVGEELSRIHIDPYSMADAEELIRAQCSETGYIVIDITCMTKPHVLAAAAVLAQQPQTSWRILYTIPETYGDLNSRRASRGWTDTLLLPLGPDPSLGNEGLSLGVIMLGHEAERSLIALEHLEPAAGAAIIFRRSDRPDLERVTRSRNRLLLERLQRLRMPVNSGLRRLSGDFPERWEVVQLEMDDVVDGTARLVSLLADHASHAHAPVVLYPFGPKLAIFVAGLVLWRQYPQASWAVYPVASTHPLDYSDGILRTVVLRGEDVPGV